jgi:5-methylcytosine-specific restriction endonuclease McrA
MLINPFDVRIKPIDVWGTQKKTKKRQLTHAQKIFAWENKSHMCNICGKRVTKFSDAEFDHTRPHSKSGATNLSNVKIVHRACNRLKGKKSLSTTKKLLGIKTKTKKKRDY